MRKVSKTQHMKTRKRLAIKIAILIVAGILISGAGYAYYLVKKAQLTAEKSYEPVENRDGSVLRENAAKPLDDNVAILFIGVDDSETRKQESNKSRSDALLLATLNNKEKTIKLVSIPRDSFVYIPEVGYKDKINHALFEGGTKATIDTVENLLEVPIDYYVRMNFNAFIDVVDALDGVYATVPYNRLEKDEKDVYSIQLTKGYQKLDGRQALALARTRKLDNDIERGKRQQEILLAIANKATSASSIMKYDDVMDAVGKNMKTDMTFDEMKSFLSYLKDGIPPVDTLYLKGYDDTSTGTYFWRLDEKSLLETKNMLKSHLEIKTDEARES